jgi:hypothetical protein
MPSLFKASIGISIAKFDFLFAELSPTIHNSTLNGTILNDKVEMGRPRAYNARDSLALFLIHIRHYEISEKMCFDYGFVSIDTMLRYLNTMRSIMFEWGEKQIVWPDHATRFNNGVYFSCSSSPKIRVTAIGDNSEQSVAEYEDGLIENSTYSGKAKDNTFTRFHLVCPRGKALYVSKSFAGAMNDANVTNIIHPERMIENDEALMLDGGYPNIKQPNVLKKKGPNDIEWNNMIDRYRVVVENHFALIKAWAICSH